MLEDGLRYYPHEQHSNMLIYIRIAASLPKKTVRDVAHHLRHMQVSPRCCLAAYVIVVMCVSRLPCLRSCCCYM